jgi:hypothetical protein
LVFSIKISSCVLPFSLSSLLKFVLITFY